MTKFGEWKIGIPNGEFGMHEYKHLGEGVYAYREVIEQKRETVTLWSRKFANGELRCASIKRGETDNIRITYDILDGVPDWSTARIEEVK